MGKLILTQETPFRLTISDLDEDNQFSVNIQHKEDGGEMTMWLDNSDIMHILNHLNKIHVCVECEDRPPMERTNVCQPCILSEI